MDTRTAPKLFVSHASEDKDRFVTPFATALRADGIDAWVDQWEMCPGDSLVERIFKHGIAQADAFAVVLSNVSVTKPWVLEELDAAVVRRIESERKRRLIPIVLDDGVKVPEALKHLRWESVPRDGSDGVQRKIVDVLLGHDHKPALGTAPAYLSDPRPAWTGVPADDAVFALIAKTWRPLTPNHMVFTNEVQEEAAGQGIDAAQFEESMHALIGRHLISAQKMAGPRWMLHPLPDRVWLRLEEEAGIDVDAIRQRLLALIVNEDVTRLVPEELELSSFTVGAVLREFESMRFLTVHLVNDGSYVISGLSPLARRHLDR